MSVAFTLGRAVVVGVIGVVGYTVVVPVTIQDRTRLAQLVVTRPGVAEFNLKPANSGEQPAGQSGITSVDNAAKRSPTHTGVYAAEWAAKTGNDAAEVVAFLLPSDSVAQGMLKDFVAMHLSETAEASSSLTRTTSSTVAGIPGSTTALFSPAPAAASPASLAVAVFRSSSVVVVAEAVSAATTLDQVNAIALTEDKHLKPISQGFTMAVVRRPVLASSVWAAGTVAAMAIAGLAPPLVAKARRRREQRRQEELDRVVRGHSITKKRRSVEEALEGNE